MTWIDWAVMVVMVVASMVAGTAVAYTSTLTFPIPKGRLKTGPNELRIDNRHEQGAAGTAGGERPESPGRGAVKDAWA
jgi:hypothetical protein